MWAWRVIGCKYKFVTMLGSHLRKGTYSKKEKKERKVTSSNCELFSMRVTKKNMNLWSLF